MPEHDFRKGVTNGDAGCRPLKKEALGCQGVALVDQQSRGAAELGFGDGCVDNGLCCILSFASGHGHRRDFTQQDTRSLGWRERWVLEEEEGEKEGEHVFI